MKNSLLLIFLFLGQSFYGQILQPGFEKREYIETLKINQRAHIPVDSWNTIKGTPNPDDYNFVYRSPVVAFDNIWDLWVHKEKPIALIAVQGTIKTEASMLANIYAAMIPASGEIDLGNDSLFKYDLASNENAAVHVGWFVAMAFLSKTVLPKIDSCYKAGIKDFILTGHSQGGAITFLLTAYLENLKQEKKLPSDIRFKTYCSAAPKPGNLFFAYDYEKITEGGWAYNVVNTADWVPEVPFSVQTVEDFSAVNPFRNVKSIIKKQKFPKNIVLKYVYNKLSCPSKKAVKKYQKYLGKMASKAVKKQIPGYNSPEYFNSNYYVRTGNTVLLHPDDEYFKLYSNDSNNPNIWQHHLPEQYLHLTKKLDENLKR